MSLVNELGLEQYVGSLLANGFDSLNMLRGATMSDLERIGLKIGHARYLLTSAHAITRPHGSIGSEHAYLSFLQAKIGAASQFSTAVRREIRATKAELCIDDATHFRLLQVVGWSQRDFEDGERCL